MSRFIVNRAIAPVSDQERGQDMHAPAFPESFDNAQDIGRGANHLAPDCAGQNFYEIDRGLRGLLQLYLEPNDFRRLERHFHRLGALAGGRLDQLARTADKHAPVLNARDRFGRDEDWIDYHSSYREMETIAFGDFQFHAMSHRAGVLGMDRSLPAVAKYALQYLFVQAEFGLMCPISVTDTSIHLIRKFASAELQDYLLPKMLSGDVATMWKGTQFMTERAGGSDVGAIETVARCEDGVWRLYGDKWFCSHADADVALLLARPEGAPGGTKGLALFALPRRLKDGGRNAYRIVRLKDKLGTRSMASGEIRLEGAVAYLVGDAARGFKQMMEQVNLSRRSRRGDDAALRERGADLRADADGFRQDHHRISLAPPSIAEDRGAGRTIALDVPVCCERDGSRQCRLEGCGKHLANSDAAAQVPRLPRQHSGGDRRHGGPRRQRLYRGMGAGAADPRCPRRRALGRHQQHQRPRYRHPRGRQSRAHRTLEVALRKLLDEATLIPAPFLDRLRLALDRTLVFAERVAVDPALEETARLAAGALYHITSAILMAWEAAQPGADPRRALYARFVLEHRLSAQDPLAPRYGDWERAAAEFVFSEQQVSLAAIPGLLDG
jgi:acyl-CoA dehydrogenase